ncbi:MAG: helix-turn-helix domain-containing protein [Victivallales bacterium]|jgi:AraC-like DNA-binding protein|nr:helix-turn-helix domain-containing protein [Victivallales bacterium]
MTKYEENIHDLQQKLMAFAALSGTGCIWKITKYLLPDQKLSRCCTYHLREFCSAVKKCDNNEGNERCMHHDSMVIHGQLQQELTPFVSVCHAGAAEIIIPLPVGTPEYSGAIMLGPFRPKDGKCKYRECEEQFQKLPKLNDEFVAQYIAILTGTFEEIINLAYLNNETLLPRRPYDQRVIDVLKFLRENFHQKLTATDAAKHVFLSTSRMLHLFRSECGINFADYLLKLRLRQARQFLLSTEWSIYKIATISGFADQSHFTALFRREFGIPPLRYRKKFSNITDGV